MFIHDIECYPNFFSDILKVNKENKLYIYILTDLSLDYESIKSKFKDYEISFIKTKELQTLIKNQTIYSYNGFNYDDSLINLIFKKYNQALSNGINWLLSEIYKESDSIINKDFYYSEYRKDRPFITRDLMRILGLDRIKKGLKLAAINLKHPTIKDLPIKPGTLLTSDIIPELLYYQLNDVLITESLLNGISKDLISPTIPKTAYNGGLEAITFREDLSKQLKIDLSNSNKSQMGEKIASLLYSKASGFEYKDFKNKQTIRDVIYYRDVIFDNIKFETKQLQDFLIKLKAITYYPENKELNLEDVLFEFEFYNCNITIAQGGIHGTHKYNKTFEATNAVLLKDLDVGSFYPYLYWKYHIEPEHLPHFTDFIGDIINMRLKYKKEGNKIYANGLKIAINRIYGGFSDKHGWLKDTQALLKTTINGQLMILMLAEQLELNGIECFYYNTDGITINCPIDKLDLMRQLCKNWEQYTLMTLEESDFSKCYIRDVNNFCSIKPDGKLKVKGEYEYYSYLEKYEEFDLTGAFDKPVISYAAVKYLTENIPIETTIRNHKDIYDFCSSEKSSKEFKNVMFRYKDSNIETIPLQKTIRYYITSDNTEKIYKTKLKSDKDLLKLVNKQIKGRTLNTYILSNAELDLTLIKQLDNGQYLYLIKHSSFLDDAKLEWQTYTDFCAGYNVKLFNEFYESNDYKINYDYYIKEAYKLVKPFEIKKSKNKVVMQTSLF